MRVVLVAATPAEHAIGSGFKRDRKDFAFSSYNYAIGLLDACVRADPELRETVDIARRDLPVPRFQTALSDAQLEDILAENPDVVGLSCYCWSLDLFLDAARRLKQSKPGVFVLLGGPSASFGADALLRANPSVDAVARGEAEESFLQLCRAGFREPWRIAGVTARDGEGAIHHDDSAACDVDISRQPSPYLAGVLRPEAPSLLIEPSRGCRFRCSFCSWSARRGPIRHQPRQRLADELRWATANGYRGASFCDTAVNHDTNRLRELVEVICEADPERKLAFSLFLRLERLDDEQLELLKHVRCEELIIGLESIHEAPLRNVGKPPIDRAALESRLSRLARDGHRVTLSIMSGLPGDTVEGFGATLDYLEEVMQRIPDAINFVCCFWLAVLPGTRFSERSRELGFETIGCGTPYVVRSKDFRPQDLVAMARMIVERADRNPRFRCEEIHREAASIGAVPAPDSATARAPSSQSGPPPSASRLEMLLSPWTPGQRRGAWIFVGASPPMAGEGIGTFSFRHGSSRFVLHVNLAARDDSRACFARTGRHNLYYRSEGAGMPGDVPRLLEVLTRLISQNEGKA